MYRKSGIVGYSDSVLKIVKVAQTVARTEATVLLQGESGTGKELFARYIHEQSGRTGPFIAISLAAIPEALVESELFGVLKGAYTSADRNRIGYVQRANGGTLFLDEIGEISAKTQVKILRLLQEKQVSALGSSATQDVDVRIIAASNRDLAAEVSKGNFRADLYYRLKVFPINIPALRDRGDDIIELVSYFFDRRASFMNRKIKFSTAALEALSTYSWPGNIRELKALSEELLMSIDGDFISLRDLPEAIKLNASISSTAKQITRQEGSGSLEHMIIHYEKNLIFDALEKCKGNIAAAAFALGVKRTTLHAKIKRYGLKVEA